MPPRTGQTRGFKRTSSLFADADPQDVRDARLCAIAAVDALGRDRGPGYRRHQPPVEVRYGRGGFGATLTLLTTGANAPILEMQKEALRAKVNAIYGYNAISKVRITQTAATGFSEGQVSFDHRPKAATRRHADPRSCREAQKVARDVHDDGLRAALERLASNVYSKTQHRT